MFFRITCLAALLALGIYWFSIRLTSDDTLRYEQLMSESVQLRKKRPLEEEPAEQKRQNVQKNMWTHNESRAFSIVGQDSNLSIRQKKDKIEAVERLNNISCTIPNTLILSADFGTYTYPLADSLAYENPKGHILAHDIHFSAKTLIWEKDTDLLHLIDDVKITKSDDLILLAEKGKVALEKFQPVRVILENNVQLLSSRIQGKESHAMADTLQFDPENQTLLFSGDKRVLFWQDGLKLSASEVLIRKDETVEGHGDVHFTFDMEEQNQINQFFKKYL